MLDNASIEITQGRLKGKDLSGNPRIKLEMVSAVSTIELKNLRNEAKYAYSKS